MTRLLHFAILALVATGSATKTVHAAEVAANTFLNVNISLNGVKQGELGITKVRISNLEIIQAIGNETAHTFSTKAKLLLKIPVGLEAGPAFVIRDSGATNVVDFEVPSDMPSIFAISLWLYPSITYRLNTFLLAGGSFVIKTCISSTSIFNNTSFNSA